MRCPLCKSELPAETAIEGSGSRQCGNCGATLDQYFNETESVALEKIGRFTLLKVLGEGGFGTVYHARDAHLEREVALKTIRFSKMGTAHLEARLVREAKAASKLNHPGIVKVFELVDVSNMKVLVEEYVEGDTLDSLIKRKKLTQKQSVEIIAKVAEALEVAHQEKVIHRDIKPANIILDAYGQPRILDFGLAKREGLDESMTEEGQLIGTVIYMSPEQANGHIDLIGQASDQYSLAICLFQMLTDELPFRGTGNVILRAIVLDDAPSLRSLNDSIPRDLENICLKALSKKISDRYSSCGAFAADLRRYLKSEPVEARPVGIVGKLERWARRNRTLAASLATIAIILLLATGVSTYFAVKSMSDLQGRISAEEKTQRSQLQLLLDGDASEIRPVIQMFRQNLEQFEGDLRTKRLDVRKEPRKLARVLLTLSDKEPGLEGELRDLMKQVPVHDGLLIHEYCRSTLSEDKIKQLWEAVKNAQLTIPERLLTAVTLSKASPRDSQWSNCASSVIADLLDPLSTPYLHQCLQQLQPIWPSLRSALLTECWNKKDKQRATLATSLYLQLYSTEIRSLVELLTELPAANVPMVIEKLKAIQPRDRVVKELQSLAEPGARRLPLFQTSAMIPIPESIKQQFQAAGGMVSETYALCAALPWSSLDLLLKEMTQLGYRPVRCRPYSTQQGLKVAAIWHRDHDPARKPNWEYITDLTASSLPALVKQTQTEGRVPVELAAYEVEPRPNVKEVRYVWIVVQNTTKQPFSVKLQVPDEEYLIQNQDWFFAGKGVDHRTGLLDLPKGGELPVLSSATGFSNNARTWTHVIRSAPQQREFDSYSPSFGYALSEDKFRLTNADFNIHHDIAWVPPQRNQTREEYFRSLTLHASQRQGKDAPKPLLISRDQVDNFRACYELAIDPPFDLVTLDKLDLEEPLASTLVMALARKGEAALAEQCLHRYISKKSLDWRHSEYLRAACTLLLKQPKDIDPVLSSFNQIASLCEDGMSKMLHAKLLCLATESMKPNDSRRSAFLAKAWKLVQETFSQNAESGFELEEWWSREFAPLAEKLEPLIQAKRGTLRYAATWSPSRGLDQQLHYGETIDLSQSLWQRWSHDNYVPYLLSATEWNGKASYISAWRRARPTPEEELAVAVRRSRVALALFELGQPDALWTAMADPSTENISVVLAHELIHLLKQTQFGANALVARVMEPCTPLLKYRILLALGEYQLEECGSLSSQLLVKLPDWLMHDPDPGVHSACDYLLRRWNRNDRIQDTWKGKSIRLEECGQRQWYRNAASQELAIVDRPAPFYMGLSVDDKNSMLPHQEKPHYRQIAYRFAMGMREVTREEYMLFDANHNFGEITFSPDANGPIGSIRWNQAAAYCNWLSRKEGIPETEWCYEPVAGGRSLQPKGNYLLLNGYRLPMETEYEYVLRGRGRLIRPSGNTADGISHYVWHRFNAQRHFHPAGVLAPNQLGLFDLLGNATEWTNDKNQLYPAVFGNEVIHDLCWQFAVQNRITPSSNVILRSMSWGAEEEFMRSSYRSNRAVNSGADSVDMGFRVARTLR